MAHPTDEGGSRPAEMPLPVRVFDTVLSGMNAIGTLWIFLLMLLVNSDVLGRVLFNHPIDGVNEMIELSIVGIVFLQLGDATRAGRLTRSDGLFFLLLERRPAIGHALGAIFDLLGAVFMGLILWGSWPRLVEAWRDNQYTGNIGVFTAPTWPIKAIIVVGTLVTLLQFLAFARRHLRGGAGPASA